MNGEATRKLSLADLHEHAGARFGPFAGWSMPLTYPPGVMKEHLHTREHAGIGLGLAICRELAQMLNATVSFVSEPGRGATFYVDLPLTHQPQAPQALMSV